MDTDYWKDAYKELWSQTSKKEKFVQELIKQLTGFDVIEAGLGAGSDEFLSGSAASYGLEKGDADLYVANADAYVEVTGPNINVNFDDALWIRPDKIKNSYNKMKSGKGRMHAVVHVARIKPDGHRVLRVVVLGDAFFKGLQSKEIRTIYPTIRGRQETYLEIPADHPSVITFDEFIANIQR